MSNQEAELRKEQQGIGPGAHATVHEKGFTKIYEPIGGLLADWMSMVAAATVLFALILSMAILTGNYFSENGLEDGLLFIFAKVGVYACSVVMIIIYAAISISYRYRISRILPSNWNSQGWIAWLLLVVIFTFLIVVSLSVGYYSAINLLS
ncbi:hypothetical protein [Allohahella sp. A8]|uniref:hypothetical protein n=1 Tax=Allohahella sp. A8 TaxID=3141461 RepID=UPI003A80B68C